MSLPSERIVVAAPLSYVGSSQRIWRLTRHPANKPAHVALVTLAILLVTVAWIGVTAWYVVFGLLLVPYRIVRRGQRKRKLDEQRHRELLNS